jgi:hypothetical protein
MWRREAVAKVVGAYDPQFRYAMDWEFWARIASRLRVATVRRILASYRDHPHSMSASHAHVARETDLARRAAMRYALGAADAETLMSLGPLLYAPVDGFGPDAGADEVTAAVSTILRLSDHFAARMELDAAALRTHHGYVRRWLGRLLMIQALRSREAGRPEQGRVLFRVARATDATWPLSMKGVRYLAAWLRGG